MHSNTGHLYGPAPAPDEIAAATQRARQLRSEVLRGYLTAARGALGRVLRDMRLALVLQPGSLNRHGNAPSWVNPRSFRGMQPDLPRRLGALWSRVPRT